MEQKQRIRFELRLTEQQRQALERMSEKTGKSMSCLVAKWIENRAKREGVWT